MMSTILRGSVAFLAGLFVPLFSLAQIPDVAAPNSDPIIHGNLDSPYYEYMEEIKEERIARYYSQGAHLSYVNLDYIEDQDQPLSFSAFAEKGHWISEGSGVIASKRHSIAQQFGTSRSSYAVQQLTIALPKSNNEKKRFVVDSTVSNGPVVFWSSWSHGGLSCFAYATTGTIDVERLRYPRSVSPERQRFFENNPYVRTLSVKLNVSFHNVLDEVEMVLAQKPRPECQPFIIDETLEFYWRPVNSVINDYQ